MGTSMTPAVRVYIRGFVFALRGKDTRNYLLCLLSLHSAQRLRLEIPDCHRENEASACSFDFRGCVLPSSAGRQARVADLSSHAHQGPTISVSLSLISAVVLLACPCHGDQLERHSFLLAKPPSRARVSWSHASHAHRSFMRRRSRR